MGRHPAYDNPTCRHEECRPQTLSLPPYKQGTEAAHRWIAGLDEHAARVRLLTAEHPGKAAVWLGVLAAVEEMRAAAWTYAHGDTAEARAERDGMRRRAGLLRAVDSVRYHVRYRHRPQRSTGYPGAGWVEPHLADALDRMAEAYGEAAVMSMLGELHQAAAEAVGEQLADVLAPFLAPAGAGRA